MLEFELEKAGRSTTRLYGVHFANHKYTKVKHLFRNMLSTSKIFVNSVAIMMNKFRMIHCKHRSSDRASFVNEFDNVENGDSTLSFQNLP